jgi:hypothetical protein
LNPQFDGKPAPGKVLVMSIAPDGTTRVFEDLMVKELEARGVAAVPSYRVLPADGTASQPARGCREGSLGRNAHVAPDRCDAEHPCRPSVAM